MESVDDGHRGDEVEPRGDGGDKGIVCDGKVLVCSGRGG